MRRAVETALALAVTCLCIAPVVGAPLSLPAGESPLTSPLGDADVVGSAGSIWQVGPGVGRVAATPTGTFRLRNATVVLAHGVALGSFIHAPAGAHVVLEDCTFVGFDDTPIVDASGAAVEVRRCRFFRSSRVARAAGGSLIVEGTEGVALPAPTAAWIELTAPTEARIAASFIGGGDGIVCSGGAVPGDIAGLTLADLAGSGIVVLEPAADVSLAGFRVAGPLGGPAVQVVAGLDGESADRHAIRLAEASLRDVRIGASTPALIVLAGTESFSTVDLSGVDATGSGGDALRLVALGDTAATTTLSIAKSNFSRWNRGLVVDRAARLDVAVSDTTFDGGLVGVALAGTDQRLSSDRGLTIRNGGTGVLLSDGASAELQGASIASNRTAGISIASGARLRLRGSSLANNGTGVVIESDAGEVDLGTADSPGGNTLRVSGPAPFAIVSRAVAAVRAEGNRWFDRQSEFLAPGAIAELVSALPGTFSVSDAGRVRSSIIRWDPAADRRTPGYGGTVLARESDVVPRLGSVIEIELAPGTFPDVFPARPDLSITGSGTDATRIDVAPDSNLFAGSGSVALRQLALAPVDESPRDGFEWTGGSVTLEQVRFDGFTSTTLELSPRRRNVTIDGLIANSAGGGGPVLDLAGTNGALKSITIAAGPDQPAIAWRGIDNDNRLAASGISATGLTAPEATAIEVTGTCSLERIDVRGDIGTAVAIHGLGESTGSVSESRIEGFVRDGIRVAGDWTNVELHRVRLTASTDTTQRASGIVFGVDAAGSLAIDDATVHNARPAVMIGGRLTGLTLDGVTADLGASFNTMFEEEEGIVLAATGAPERWPTMRRLEIEGFDTGLHLTAAHDVATTHQLGTYQPDGASTLTGNQIGIRMAAPHGTLMIREDRRLSRIRENGIGILALAGWTSVENADVSRNGTGVRVEGGVVDLGGGSLRSRGSNLMWPQTGAFAISNRAQATVSAIGNLWGEAEAILATDAAPIEDKRRDATLGSVVTTK